MLAFYKIIEARIWARDSNPRAAGTALAAAERLLSSAANHSGDDPTWINFFDHARLAADATEIHRDLAMPTQAL
ncbi:MAG: sporulation associated protein, partial [Pseudonocardiaceae bacterium]